MAQNHYVNNTDLLNALIQYRKNLNAARKTKTEAPAIGDYIGTCFLKIAEHLSRKPNFMSYTFREDMISDAVENCLQCVNNFDPMKSKNPFSYFTQIIYFAFLRRISKEKKQLYVKYKATEQLGLLHNSDQHDLEKIGQERRQAFQVYENISDFIHTYERGREEKKRNLRNTKTATLGVLQFIGDSNE